MKAGDVVFSALTLYEAGTAKLTFRLHVSLLSVEPALRPARPQIFNIKIKRVFMVRFSGLTMTLERADAKR